MDDKKIIQLQNIVKVFRVKTQDVLVLKGINLEIEKGDFALIYGPSGCGKSTLLHAMLGLEIPTSGKVRVSGVDLYEKDEDGRAEFRKKTFGMVYQQQNWIRALSVLENLAFPLSLAGVPKWQALDRAKASLKKVGLSEWSEYKPTELSAGQQQKVALAMALVTNPEIIVADEPTGNLDYRSGRELMNLFKKLNDDGRTIILVTHDLGNLEYAKTVLHMFDGQIARRFDTAKEKMDSIKKTLLERKDGAVSGKGAIRDKALTRKALGYKDVSGQYVERQARERKGIILKTINFTALLLLHLGHRAGSWVFNLDWMVKSKVSRLRPYLTRFYLNIYNRLEKNRTGSISRADLIDLSLQNMMAKKSRTFVTIGGMMLAVGFIVFLVSIGYGLESLVVSKVATLNEMNQIEASPAVASNIRITDASLASLESISGVEKVLPVISVAGKVDYQNSSTDVVVYGVLSDYLRESSVRPTEGTIFEDNDGSAEGLREVVVNQAFLRVLGIGSGEAVGEKFYVSFALTGELLDEEERQADVEVEASESIEYKIVGVTSDVDTAVAYIPIADLKQLGVDNYSQVKLVVESQSLLDGVRKQVEVLGFKTTAVADTVSQVESLFSTLRKALWMIGLVALSVAAFGMFNTLTVSLLERTREVGFMKALGMKSGEVHELFLTESMTMGLFGGAGGVLLGFLGGKLLSLILSVVSVSRGYGLISVTSLPLLFVGLVVILAAGVGVVTGRYPARRATKISALDALRYE